MCPTLSEAESKALLAAHGVPVVEDAVVDGPTAAVEAAERLGYPVAVKLCGDAIAHKTERGLVRLGLADGAAVEHASTELLGAATPDDGEVGLLIAPMVTGNRELIAGLSFDPQFGMTVMIGVGGVLAEAIADVAFRLVPIERVDAAEMIEQLRTQALLEPFRGEPVVDREALIDVLVGLSDTAVARPDVASADLNPLIIQNGRPVAVDALVELIEAGVAGGAA